MLGPEGNHPLGAGAQRPTQAKTENNQGENESQAGDHSLRRKLKEGQPLVDQAVPSQSLLLEGLRQGLAAFHQKIGRRFKTRPLSQDLMQAANLFARSPALGTVGKVRLVKRSLLRRKIAVKIERHVFLEFPTLHKQIS